MDWPRRWTKKNIKNVIGLDYVDLYLEHWLKFFKYNEKHEIINKLRIHVVWPLMEKLVEKWYTKYFSVSNYNVHSLFNLLSFCKIKPLVNEIEFHPYLVQTKLVEFCIRENIILFGYNPLVKGIYCKETADEKDRNLLSEQIILNLAKKYNKNVGQLVLNWSISREVIPLPMISNPNRIIENLNSTDFVFEKEDLEKIDKLNRNRGYGKSKMWNIYDKENDVLA